MKFNQGNNPQWTIIKNSFAILSKDDKKRLSQVTFLQIILGFLDLVGIALIGLVAVISVNGIQALEPGSRVTKVIDLFGLTTFTFQIQVAIIGTAAALLLIIRTLLTMIISKRILFYLGRRAAKLSSSLFSKLLSQDLLTISLRTSQETLYAVTTGVNALFLNVVGAVINLSSDLFLLIILSAGLLSLNPLMGLITFLMFTSVSFVMYFSVQKRISYLGNENVDLSIKSNEKILEVLNSYRELFVRNRRSYYSAEIANSRLAIANTSAELTFIPNVGKYVIEITLVVGAVGICAIQFLLQDAIHAITILSVFLASATRIAPAVLRIQSGLIAIKGSVGAVNRTLELIDDFKTENTLVDKVNPLVTDHIGFEASVTLENINFKYPASKDNFITDIDLQILPGEVIAFVGPSGAGKTTLIDLALGVLQPTSGKVSISGISPVNAIEKWPGAIAYVPQDVQVIGGSVRNNIAMGFSGIEQIDSLIRDAIQIAQLENMLIDKNSGLELNVGERGNKLSGGQRQRLGIARALYTKPKLIALDEATSSLDGQTEADLSQAIFALKGRVTVLLIAHRLSTVKKADKVVYMESGKILAIGTFEEVRSKIPNFDKQAKLMEI
jgi:ABC-type multidrug transport system fused ATPase/permease subunit